MTARPQLPDRAPRAKGVPTALDGLLVVDFTRVIAGPACTQTLADFGAEVIKIENPDGGDDTRSYEHADLAGESAAFVSLNRNKRGIALDLTKPAGRDVARELISARGCGGGEFFRRRDGAIWPRLCRRRPDKPPVGLLLDLGLWPPGAVCNAPRFRSDHAGRKRLHVVERLSGRTAGADGIADRRLRNGNVGLQRHSDGAVCPRSARPRPACRGRVVRHRDSADGILRHGSFDDGFEFQPSGQLAERVSLRRRLPCIRRAVLYRLRQ